MFRSGGNESGEKRLKNILKQYDDLAAHDPDVLRLLIPAEELWRFFVDGPDQLDGWHAYEGRESGYLSALYCAFNVIFDVKRGLSNAFIKHLHYLACSNVSSTNYAKYGYEDSRIDEYRLDGDAVTFRLVNGDKSNYSMAGIHELLAAEQSFRSEQSIQISFVSSVSSSRILLAGCRDVLKLNSKTIESVRMDLKRWYDILAARPDRISPDNLHLLKKTTDSKSLLSLAGCITELIKSQEGVNTAFKLIYTSEQQDTLLTLNSMMATFIGKFERSVVGTTNKFLKLRAIVSFIKRAEQLHPFLDANCRTLCMLLLNHLLIKHGFPLAILPDPNRFDMCSVDELVEDVMKGMENTFDLIASRKLFGVKTDEIVDRYSRKPSTRLSLGLFSGSANQELVSRSRPGTKRSYAQFNSL